MAASTAAQRAARAPASACATAALSAIAITEKTTLGKRSDHGEMPASFVHAFTTDPVNTSVYLEIFFGGQMTIQGGLLDE